MSIKDLNFQIKNFIHLASKIVWNWPYKFTTQTACFLWNENVQMATVCIIQGKKRPPKGAQKHVLHKWIVPHCAQDAASIIQLTMQQQGRIWDSVPRHSKQLCFLAFPYPKGKKRPPKRARNQVLHKGGLRSNYFKKGLSP